MAMRLRKSDKDPNRETMKALTFGDKLVQIRAHFDITICEMADKMGANKSNISRYERDIVTPSVEFLEMLHKHYQINLNWFFDDTEEMIYSQTSRRKYKTYNLTMREINKDIEPLSFTSFGIPLYGNVVENESHFLPISGYISAGEPLEIKPDEIYGSIPFPVKKTENVLDQYLVFIVNGLSMSPEIAHRDIVFIKRNENWIDLNNKIVAVMINGNMTLKKMFIEESKKRVVFKALNQDFGDIVINFDMMEGTFLVGELKAIRRL
jgi:SOS-response transcriptional repressor LexA